VSTVFVPNVLKSVNCLMFIVYWHRIYCELFPDLVELASERRKVLFFPFSTFYSD
jgi:hypothetical protein